MTKTHNNNVIARAIARSNPELKEQTLDCFTPFAMTEIHNNNVIARAIAQSNPE
jgi:hypothetical protein